MEFPFAEAVAAVGALGMAAYGITESLGKALSFGRGWRLPMVGFGSVLELMRGLEPALCRAYGGKAPGQERSVAEEVIRQAYRRDRGKGRAPELLRQGVRLGLPFLEEAEATRVIESTWGMGREQSAALARALHHDAGATGAPTADIEAAGMAARFGTILDQRIEAAFALAEVQYRTTVRTGAGLVAVVLSLAFTLTHPVLVDESGSCSFELANTPGACGPENLVVGLIIGLAAVPLAPVAKDLSSALSDALRAWRSIPRKDTP